MRTVALVTGGAQGIGLGIARALAGSQCDIVIADIQNEENVADGLEALRGCGAKVMYRKADISDCAAHEALLAAIREQFGRLNVLVNNAGVAPHVRADILDATPESYDRVMNINLRGPYFLTRMVCRWMIEQRQSTADFGGCIINISSISATTASPSRGEYCISKAGISMATRLYAVRMAEYDIPVYEIRPGIIKTDMTAAVKEKYDSLISRGLLLQKRWGLPDDIGKAAAMLVRGELSYSTGQVIMVDGGFSVERL